MTIVENTLLTPEFRARISERERQRDFPFSIHNIYRVLMAAEPVLLEGWLTIAGRQQLSEHDPGLGTSLRCLRYLHVLLVAARHAGYLAGAALEPMARRALGMLRYPSCFCRGHLPLPGPAAGIPPDVGLRLAATLRQYADVRWLGQHDQGFIGWPPRLSGDAGVIYSRCFGNLPAVLGLRTVAITVAYDLPDAGGIAFDLFRGELVAPPPREAVRWCAVTDGSTQRPLTGSQCQQLLTAGGNALRRARLVFPATEAEGNWALAEMFMGELLAAARAHGVAVEGWRRSVQARLAMPLRLRSATMTDAYLDRLTEAVAGWRAQLALATD